MKSSRTYAYGHQAPVWNGSKGADVLFLAQAADTMDRVDDYNYQYSTTRQMNRSRGVHTINKVGQRIDEFADVSCHGVVLRIRISSNHVDHTLECWACITTSSQKLSQHELRFYLIHILREHTWTCTLADPRKGQMSCVRPLQLQISIPLANSKFVIDNIHESKQCIWSHFLYTYWAVLLKMTCINESCSLRNLATLEHAKVTKGLGRP